MTTEEVDKCVDALGIDKSTVICWNQHKDTVESVCAGVQQDPSTWPLISLKAQCRTAVALEKILRVLEVK